MSGASAFLRINLLNDAYIDANWQQLLQDVDRQYEAAGRAAVLEEANSQLSAFIFEYTK